MLTLLLTAAMAIMPAAASAQLFDDMVEYAAGDGPIFVCKADLDGDGDEDLAVANRDSENVSIFLNNGKGNFADAVNFNVEFLSMPMSICAADLDGDTDIDLALPYHMSGRVMILWNDGSGSFTLDAFYLGLGSGCSIAAADFDRDDDIDLVVSHYESGVSIFENDGTGTFISKTDYAVPGYLISVCAADLNGDLWCDIAVNDYSYDGSGMSVLVNSGDGTFATPVTYTTGINPLGLAAADLENDGDLDLIVGNEFSLSVSVFENNGDATFADGVEYDVLSPPNSVCAADLNNDTYTDLAVAVRFKNSVQILINDGDATFTAENAYDAGNAPYSVCAGDFDDDTDNDLAVAVWYADSLAILKNTTVSKGKGPGNGPPEGMPPLSNYPNPFNPSTIIEFALETRQPVNLAVYNINGQRIRQLADREFEAGTHSLNWDGRDESGEPVATGVYFYRFKAGDNVQSKKMVLLK